MSGLALVSTPLGGHDSNERYEPSDEGSDTEVPMDSQEQSEETPEQQPNLFDLVYVPGQGAGYTSCDISSLPNFSKSSRLFQYKLLSNLNISNFRNLDSLQDLVAQLPNLKILVADNCAITTIVDVPFPSGLQILSLSSNSLASLPVLNDMEYLESIDVSRNRLNCLFSQVFACCYSLQEINASGNEISEVDLSSFGDCLKLETLDFSNNEIKESEVTWPETPLEQVRYIDISGNKFEEIPAAIATCFPGIFRFDISDNNLTISPDLNIDCLSDLSYLYEFNISDPIDTDVLTRSLTIFYLQNLKKLNNIEITTEEKVNVEQLFKPSLMQRARNDHINQELFELKQHRSEIPNTCLPNTEAYPIFIFTSPSLILRDSVKSLVSQAESYIPVLKRTTPVLDHPMSEEEQTAFEYICETTDEFNQKEQAGGFCATGSCIDEPVVKFGLSKEFLESNCEQGFGTVVEMPITAALSLQMSEKYRPHILLVMPKEEEYIELVNKHLTDETIKIQAMEEYYALHKINQDQPSLFQLTISPSDVDVCINYLFSLLGETNHAEPPSNQSTTGSTCVSDWSSEQSTQASSQALTPRKVFSAILPSDITARRASLIQQARRKSAARSKSLAVGANMVFDLSKETLVFRTSQALKAITRNTNGIGGFDLKDEFIEDDDGMTATPRTRLGTGSKSRGDTETEPDWEAEGIIVLPDDAQTLSNCPNSERGRLSSAGGLSSMRSSIKTVLPPISPKL